MSIPGYYGSNRTSCEVYTYDGWYCVDGSVNVNRTDEELLVPYVWVEELPDFDFFTAGAPIESEEDLIAAVDE